MYTKQELQIIKTSLDRELSIFIEILTNTRSYRQYILDEHQYKKRLELWQKTIKLIEGID